MSAGPPSWCKGKEATTTMRGLSAYSKTNRAIHLHVLSSPQSEYSAVFLQNRQYTDFHPSNQGNKSCMHNTHLMKEFLRRGVYLDENKAMPKTPSFIPRLTNSSGTSLRKLPHQMRLESCLHAVRRITLFGTSLASAHISPYGKSFARESKCQSHLNQKVAALRRSHNDGPQGNGMSAREYLHAELSMARNEATRAEMRASHASTGNWGRKRFRSNTIHSLPLLYQF